MNFSTWIYQKERQLRFRKRRGAHTTQHNQLNDSSREIFMSLQTYHVLNIIIHRVFGWRKRHFQTSKNVYFRSFLADNIVEGAHVVLSSAFDDCYFYLLEPSFFYLYLHLTSIFETSTTRHIFSKVFFSLLTASKTK